MARQTSDAAQAAKIIRAELKKQGVSAKVTSSTYSQGSSVDVALFDCLPATKQLVEQFAKQYAWESKRNSELPQARFVFVKARFSNELKKAAKEFVNNSFNLAFYSEFEIENTMPRQVLTGYLESNFWTARKPRQLSA